MITKAVITAAGFGSRFLPITKTFPKEMLPIGDKPIIHHLVEECQEAGIQEVIIVVSPSEVKKFEEYFYGRANAIRTLMIRQEKLERWDKVEKVFSLPLITIVPQDESIPYGNGRPILTVKDFVEHDEAFAVLFGDDIVFAETSATKQLIDFFNKSKCDAVLGVQNMPKDVIHKFGMVITKDGTLNQVERVHEKPEDNEIVSTLASYGRFVLTPKIFTYLRADELGKDNEVWLQDANAQLAQVGTVLAKEVEGEWMTTGDPHQYLQAHIRHALEKGSNKQELITYLKEIISKHE